MPDTTEDHGQPDPRALAVAQALQRQLPDTAEVVLFGSRASGDWQPWSDIDLAVIDVDRDREKEFDARELALTEAKSLYPKDWSPPVQITHLPRSEFETFRTSLPHIAGQVQRWGLTATGNHFPSMPQDSPWPGVQALLQAAQDQLNSAVALLRDNNNNTALFHAHAALKIILKAALGASRVDFRKIHGLADQARCLGAESHGASWWGDELSLAQLKELSDFRLPSLYGGANKQWPQDPPDEIVGATQQVCGRLAGRILEHLGKTPGDVKYEHWLKDEPFGGVESIPLPPSPHLSEADQVTIGVLRTFLDGMLPSDDLERIANSWQENGPPSDALVRIRNVQTNPSEWRRWLSLSATDSDSDTPPPRQEPKPRPPTD